jgi:hypothetical protein
VRGGSPHADAQATPASTPLGSPCSGHADAQATPASVPPSSGRSDDGLLASPAGAAAGPLSAGGPSVEKEAADMLVAACAAASSSLVEAQGTDESTMDGGSSAPLIRPKRISFPEHFCYCFSSNLCVLNTTNTD